MSPGRTRRPLMIALGEVPVMTPVTRTLSTHARNCGETTGTAGTGLVFVEIVIGSSEGGGGKGAISIRGGAGGAATDLTAAGADDAGAAAGAW